MENLIFMFLKPLSTAPLIVETENLQKSRA